MSSEAQPATRAVFLSYASQDSGAARRICDALGAAGIEVWLDQSELSGGDAWDQKIRRQIRECALFLPVISANTNARLEGYFRREWKLAVERTHDMADERKFLVPVVIDDTADAAASVPEKFREVQWTRLRDGVATPAFCARVRELLDGPGGAPAVDRRAPAVAPVIPKRGSFQGWVVAAGLVVAVAGIGWWSLRLSAPAGAAPKAAETKADAPVAAAVNDRSIAVLPFANLSDEKENAYFADGMHDDLLTNLANLRALKVVSRTSVMQYRGTTKNIREIARDLGVAFVLEGSVRRAGNTIRVTGQLIRAATDEHLWAKNFDRDLKDIFAVQSELAREIATALNATLSPTEVSELEARPTKNLEAYDCFQKARVLSRASGTNERDLREEIIPLLMRAVARDPGYAEAWAELGRQQLNLYQMVDRSEALLAKAKEALAQAERLAPDSYSVLIAGASLGAVLGNREMVNDRRRRIIELFPHRPEALQAMALTAVYDLRLADALASYRAALRLDPRNPEVLNNYFFFLDSLRRWDDAEPVARTLAEVQPDNLEARLTAASMAFRRSGSTAQLTRLLADLPRGDDGNVIATRQRIAFLTGDWAGIVALWREHGERFRTGGFLETQARFMVVGAMLRLGDRASAQPLLEQNRAELRQKLAANPGDIARWNDLGLALGMLGDAAGARTALDHAAELIAANRRGAMPLFSARWDNALYRAWVEEKSSVVAKLGPLLREPTPHPSPCCVRVLRVHWASSPLDGDPEFEAMLNDPRNNAPLF